MKIETTQTEKRTIDVPVPSFYKDHLCSSSITDLIGIFDEKTVVKVYESGRRTAVQNFDIELDSGDIVTAFLKWQPISEQDFFTVYERALHSMSLTPELAKEGKVNDDNEKASVLAGTKY